ncbi:hypothetical protein ADUPG1_011869 [Aduncisulcus paluster]|uniref:Uncharacterized protein n=1 Tax=Aduncisulcus paluster TaxID=2918883 RepID=A0ABQ5JZB5_9EUKA|nr:hypothetical protein ADUPG1_011869 [Aduncisulcus paluster]
MSQIFLKDNNEDIPSEIEAFSKHSPHECLDSHFPMINPKDREQIDKDLISSDKYFTSTDKFGSCSSSKSDPLFGYGYSSCQKQSLSISSLSNDLESSKSPLFKCCCDLPTSSTGIEVTEPSSDIKTKKIEFKKPSGTHKDSMIIETPDKCSFIFRNPSTLTRRSFPIPPSGSSTLFSKFPKLKCVKPTDHSSKHRSSHLVNQAKGLSCAQKVCVTPDLSNLTLSTLSAAISYVNYFPDLLSPEIFSPLILSSYNFLVKQTKKNILIREVERLKESGIFEKIFTKISLAEAGKRRHSEIPQTLEKEMETRLIPLQKSKEDKNKGLPRVKMPLYEAFLERSPKVPKSGLFRLSSLSSPLQKVQFPYCKKGLLFPSLLADFVKMYETECVELSKWIRKNKKTYPQTIYLFSCDDVASFSSRVSPHVFLDLRVLSCEHYYQLKSTFPLFSTSSIITASTGNSDIVMFPLLPRLLSDCPTHFVPSSFLPLIQASYKCIYDLKKQPTPSHFSDSFPSISSPSLSQITSHTGHQLIHQYPFFYGNWLRHPLVLGSIDDAMKMELTQPWSSSIHSFHGSFHSDASDLELSTHHSNSSVFFHPVVVAGFPFLNSQNIPKIPIVYMELVQNEEGLQWNETDTTAAVYIWEVAKVKNGSKRVFAPQFPTSSNQKQKLKMAKAIKSFGSLFSTAMIRGSTCLSSKQLQEEEVQTLKCLFRSNEANKMKEITEPALYLFAAMIVHSLAEDSFIDFIYSTVKMESLKNIDVSEAFLKMDSFLSAQIKECHQDPERLLRLNQLSLFLEIWMQIYKEIE